MGDTDRSMVRRDFRKNPITEQELQECRWYVIKDDLIGGYNIANVDKPASHLDPYNGDFELGCFMTKEMAEHVTQLHNSWWDRYVWNSYLGNIKYDRIYGGLTEDDWFDYDDDHETSR